MILHLAKTQLKLYIVYLFIDPIISTKYKSINHPNHAKLVLISQLTGRPTFRSVAKSLYVRAIYREKNNDRVPILVVLTDKMPPDNSTLDFPLRMPIYIPNFGMRGLSKNLIM